MYMDGIKNYLIDMDGVIVRGATLLPGAAEFVKHLRTQGIPFLILTNNSLYTPRDLQVRPSFIVHPTPVMMRSALRAIHTHSEETVMMGDRRDTDTIAGIESGLRTILVLTGVTRREQLKGVPDLPTWVLESIADVAVDS